MSSQKRIALKIDVDTCHGTLIGVPALLNALQEYQAQATFFLTLGPDYSGCEARGTSLKRHYKLKTRLVGRYLPAPDIGKRGADIMRQIRAAGHETAIHTWNRFRWEQGALNADTAWIEREMGRACARYEAIFTEKPSAFGAAGWQTNRHALRLTQRLGFSYASDSRGNVPFIPVIDGEIIGCPQIPTTLPTLDELLVLEPELTPENAARRLLQLVDAIPGDHVFTLRAELEGMKYQSFFAQLLAGWQERDYPLLALRDICDGLDINKLPRHDIAFSPVSGRPGKRCTQGPEFLAEYKPAEQ